MRVGPTSLPPARVHLAAVRHGGGDARRETPVDPSWPRREDVPSQAADQSEGVRRHHRPEAGSVFNTFSTNPAVAILKDDHDRVKELFDRFEAVTSRAANAKVVRKALTELEVHAALEEEFFHPAVRKPAGKAIMNEADEAHHVAKLLIAELDRMDGSESHFDAKFTVLAEIVRHHTEEEENEMLPRPGR